MAQGGGKTTDSSSDLLEFKEEDYYSSDYELEADAPKGFKGRLVGDDKWMRCPYYPNHTFRLKKDSVHLTNCRKKYALDRQAQGLHMDVAVCRYMGLHHVPERKLKKHELTCLAGNSVYSYLESYIENQRLSKQKKKGHRKGETKGEPEVENAKKTKEVKTKEEVVKAEENGMPVVNGQGSGHGRGMGMGRGRGRILVAMQNEPVWEIPISEDFGMDTEEEKYNFMEDDDEAGLEVGQEDALTCEMSDYASIYEASEEENEEYEEENEDYEEDDEEEGEYEYETEGTTGTEFDLETGDEMEDVDKDEKDEERNAELERCRAIIQARFGETMEMMKDMSLGRIPAPPNDKEN